LFADPQGLTRPADSLIRPSRAVERRQSVLKTTKLDHIGVYLDDIKSAKAWYVDHLGCKTIGEFKLPQGHEIVFVREPVSGTTYELVGQPVGSAVYQVVKGGKGLIDHVAFAVEDIEASFSQAKTEGLDIIEGIISLPELWANGYRYFMVRTSSGEKVEFGQVL
jgi:lactoylglutathione lyase